MQSVTLRHKSGQQTNLERQSLCMQVANPCSRIECWSSAQSVSLQHACHICQSHQVSAAQQRAQAVLRSSRTKCHSGVCHGSQRKLARLATDRSNWQRLIAKWCSSRDTACDTRKADLGTSLKAASRAGGTTTATLSCSTRSLTPSCMKHHNAC